MSAFFDELQLDLEIASSGVPTKVRPHEPLLQPGQRCVETSDDAIEDYFISTPDGRIWDLSPMRLGAAKTARESAKSRDDPISRTFSTAPEKENTRNDGP